MALRVVRACQAVAATIAAALMMALVATAAENPVEQPWLRINAGGHTAAVRALAYTPDGKRLSSAGLDKSVQVWNLTAVARDLHRTVLRERTIRWQVARGLRGSIFALASSPGDGLLALGGYGAMGSLGEILLVNPVEGRLVKVLEGHRQTVCAMAFSSDGNWLASSDAEGRAILWRRGAWPARTIRETDANVYAPALARRIQEQPKLRPIALLGNSQVVAPRCLGLQSDGRLGWRLERVAIEPPAPPVTLDPIHRGMVTALAASPSGRLLASADLAGRLFLWDLKSGEPPAELGPGGVVLALCFSPDERTLAVGTAVDPARKTSQLQVWNVAARTLRRSRSLPDHVHACAVSPDSKNVAYVGGSDNDIFVAPLEAPPQALTLRGSGRRILKVAFARQEPLYRIAMGCKQGGSGFNDYAALDESFDPLRLDLGPAGPLDPADWLPVDWCRGSWTAQPQADGGLQLYRDGTPQGRIALDSVFEGRVRSYCWIAGAKGDPIAIAVGTDVQNSVYVFRLAAKGTCPILRHFRGHHDFVTSLAVSSDQRYLASASADGTVIFWSLASLERGGEIAGRWGADFTPRGADLVANAVEPAGPLFAKGMRDGDVLRQIRWNGGQAIHAETSPAAIRRQLQELPWGTQVALDSARGGERLPTFQLLPAWQPLATLFTSADRQWAFWTPQGYYDASINGYTLFGWQVNRGLASLPDFYRADQFRQKLERPDVMERLLPAGSLERAFEAAKLRPPAQSQRVLPEQIAATPRLEILSPRPGEIVVPSATTLRARIVMPAANKLVDARVFANGVAAVNPRLVRQQELAAGRELVYDWDVRLPADPRSLIQLVVGTDAPTAAFRDVLIERPPDARPERAARLRVVAVGIDKYRDPAIRRLSFAVADAESVAQLLQERSKGHYTVEAATILKDEQATPERWRETLQRLSRDWKEQARPDDLLVLFFAGHGIVDPESGQYYFIGYDFKAEDLAARRYAACIAWNDFRSLAGIACRKLVLLDTCHAGAIQPLRSRTLKAAVRALQDDVIFTFAASAGDEQSAENKAWQHGAFTQALLEALGGRTPARAGRRILLNETVDYVQSAVRRTTNGRQNPTAAPDEILPFTTVVLAVRE